MKKLLSLLLTIVVAMAVVLGGSWYRYVNNAEGPYNEVGIELNSRMPLPIRKWGCDKLHVSFAGAIPPYGCQAEDGNWI